MPAGSLFVALNLVLSIVSAVVVFALAGHLLKVKATYEVFEKILKKIKKQ